jgi:hypothetical protein
MKEFEATAKTISMDDGITTDFNMAAADFTLIFKFSWTVSQLSYDVENGEPEKVFEFFNAMRELWDRIRVMLLVSREPIDKKFEDLEPRIRALEAYKDSVQFTLPLPLRRELQTLKRDILQKKQDCGAGVPRRKKMNDAQRISNALK